MIKPDAMQHMGKIIGALHDDGFFIRYVGLLDSCYSFHNWAAGSNRNTASVARLWARCDANSWFSMLGLR